MMQHRLHVQVRGWNGLETVQNAAFDEGLFCYLKYISNLDLGNTLQPQSGNFQYEFRQELLYFASPCCRRLKNRQRYCAC
ncbi:MAG: hypothetical protein ACLRL6_13710 [Clostridium sp.]